MRMADLPSSVVIIDGKRVKKKKEVEPAKRGTSDDVLALIEHQPMSAPDIAFILGINLTTAHKRLNHLKRKSKASKSNDRPALWFRIRHVEYSGMRGVVRVK